LKKYIQKKFAPVLIFIACTLITFGIYCIQTQNYEFLVYIIMITGLTWGMLKVNTRYDMPQYIFWCLAVWAFLHLSGGTVYFNEVRLFDWILLPLSSTYPILRYDQILHMFAYGILTYVLHKILRPYFPNNKKGDHILIITLLAMGLGFGALYEILEFFTTVFIENHGVGGYVNNSLDLVFDFLGALIAVCMIFHSKKSS